MWKLCTEVFPHPFLSLWGAAALYGFDHFNKCVHQGMIENPHKSWFSNAHLYSMNRMTMSLWNKTIFCLFHFLSSLSLQGNSIWLHAAVSRCITQHLKENFWFLLNINHEYIITLACFTAFTVTNLNQNTFDNIIQCSWEYFNDCVHAPLILNAFLYLVE